MRIEETYRYRIQFLLIQFALATNSSRNFSHKKAHKSHK